VLKTNFIVAQRSNSGPEGKKVVHSVQASNISVNQGIFKIFNSALTTESKLEGEVQNDG
jgi:hypothetical protein